MIIALCPKLSSGKAVCVPSHRNVTTFRRLVLTLFSAVQCGKCAILSPRRQSNLRSTELCSCHVVSHLMRTQMERRLCASFELFLTDLANLLSGGLQKSSL